MTDLVLSTEDLCVGYHPHRRRAKVVARGISVRLRAGELVCLLGPNGAGKSTLLRTIAGLQRPIAGRVLHADMEMSAMRPADLARRLGVVLTDRIDVDSLCVRELVSFGRHPYTNWLGKLDQDDEAAITWALSVTDATQLSTRLVAELSDGERQKVLIARALAQEPRVMILDEPTAFLDLPRRVEIVRLLRQLASQTGRAVVLSTHDLDLALRSADTIWLMPMGGPILAGVPEELVLAGTLAEVFHREGVSFDARTGTFCIHEATRGSVGLVGSGLEAQWTAHALERLGFEVAAGAIDLSIYVQVTKDNGRARWRSIIDDDACEHGSLAELVARLKSARPRGS
jgi:iron complex transport system ATP-binding protein